MFSCKLGGNPIIVFAKALLDKAIRANIGSPLGAGAESGIISINATKRRLENFRNVATTERTSLQNLASSGEDVNSGKASKDFSEPAFAVTKETGEH